MFTTLIESSPRSDRRAVQGLLSLVFHVALGVGALEASRRAVVATIDGPKVDTMPFVVAAPPPAPTPVVAPTSAEPGPPVPADPVVVDVPTDIPVGIPPVPPGPAIDKGRFIIGSLPPGCGGCLGSTSTVASTDLFTEDKVDEPVQVVAQPAPGYPAVLRTAGLTGRVVIKFVVDSAGRVEPASVEILEESHPAFGESARQAILRSKFRPARVKGVSVRQLVQQAIRFSLQ